MKNIKKKFNLVDLAEEAFHSCVVFGVDTIFKNREKDPTRFLLVSNSTSSIGVDYWVMQIIWDVADIPKPKDKVGVLLPKEKTSRRLVFDWCNLYKTILVDGVFFCK